MIRPEELAVFVNTLAIAIAEGKTISEIELISAVFLQISDTLGTIALQKSRIEECLELNKTKNT